MARIVISYVFAGGDQMQVAVTGKTTYPDALSQMKAEAVAAFRDVAAHMLQAVPADEDAE